MLPVRLRNVTRSNIVVYRGVRRSTHFAIIEILGVEHLIISPAWLLSVMNVVVIGANVEIAH